MPKRISHNYSRKMAADNELSKGAFTRSKAKKARAATTTAAPRRNTVVLQAGQSVVLFFYGFF